jgi:hypothetical protein
MFLVQHGHGRGQFDVQRAYPANVVVLNGAAGHYERVHKAEVWRSQVESGWDCVVQLIPEHGEVDALGL